MRLNWDSGISSLIPLSDTYIAQNVTNSFRLMLEDKSTMVYFGFLMLILTMGLVGPWLSPYQYDATLYNADGTEILRSEPPSLAHPLGTTDTGQDVFSRLLYGARPTVVAGLLGGFLIISIGLLVGIVSGYVGGRVDSALMRFTDFVYSVPLLPFAIVLTALFGVGFISSVLIIGLLLWRGSARVIRSQVLQIKERPFILAAKATGASPSRIILKHVLPNIATMAVLFFALGIGYTIVIQAGLAFVGAATPFTPSWGVMIRNAYNSGQMVTAWWWSIPPGLLLSFTVLSAFMFGRGYENVVSQAEDSAFIQAG